MKAKLRCGTIMLPHVITKDGRRCLWCKTLRKNIEFPEWTASPKPRKRRRKFDPMAYGNHLALMRSADVFRGKR